MKKVISILLLCLTMTSAVYAEKDANHVRQQKARLVGITIGYIQSSMYESAPLISPTTISHNEYNRFHGFVGGLTLNPEFGAGIGILTGVQYAYTPTFTRRGERHNYTRYIRSLQEVVIPLRLQYRYAFTPNFSVFAYTGPSFNIGTKWHQYNEDIVNDEVTQTRDFDFYSQDVLNSENDNGYVLPKTLPYARFHCMWGLGIGIIFNQHFRVEYCADWGINDITPYAEKFTHLNRPVNILLSYMF